MSNQSFEEKLQELRNFFISTTLPDYMQAITSRWQKLQQDWDQESCRKCIFELHSLKGSSGTLGYDQISDVLNQFIKNLRAIDASSQPPSKLQLVELEVLFASLTFSHQALLNKRQHPTDRHAIAAPKHSLRPITLNPQEIKILIVEHKQSENASIQKQLAEFGFDTHHVHSLNEAKVYVTQYPVELVMLDLAIPNVAADDIYQFAASLEENDIRSFIVSEHDNFELRLGAVNANVSNYVIKPYQVTNLVAKIRSALLLDMMRPFKVLLVDDQPLWLAISNPH
ncbi:response regulator [Paraglaciecola aquimarina]|uniref:Response regulator n=1 Tax=Paraglaciecola aquimarina TaxID=1235557 RepID=A0ABU3T1N4_9ALTE|nr:response regulator [Paraglaciecola aquimarina]MDU0356160.1 response regulator [Paraglaciecola aquimarina]